MSTAHISRVLSGEYKPGDFFCIATAKAFGIQREIVFREAGILPPFDKDRIFYQQLCEVAGKLVRDGDLQELVYLANLKLENQEKEKKDDEEKRKKK